jgi:peptidyl-tRNA hydrolase, PTH1 family
MPRAKRLIIGLGNPGVEYEETRHNVGFQVVNAVARQVGIVFKREHQALVGWGRVRQCAFGVAMPQSYMNLSGRSVVGLTRANGLDSTEILVVVDDINLEPGRIRIRQRGSAGGHNGLEDIIYRLGTDDFPRLRMGIGSGFSRGRQSEYVLSPFSDEERPVMEQAIADARDAAIAFACEGLMVAMNRYNR